MEPTCTEQFDNATKVAYEMLENKMKEEYCSVHTRPVKMIDAVHSDAIGANLTKSVNVFVNRHPYNTLRKQNSYNYYHDVLSGVEMR